MLLTWRGKTGWREVEIGRGSSERTSGHSLHAGLASSAEIDERYVQKDLCRVGGNDPPLLGASRPLRIIVTKVAGL